MEDLTPVEEKLFNEFKLSAGDIRTIVKDAVATFGEDRILWLEMRADAERYSSYEEYIWKVASGNPWENFYERMSAILDAHIRSREAKVEREGKAEERPPAPAARPAPPTRPAPPVPAVGKTAAPAKVPAPQGTLPAAKVPAPPPAKLPVHKLPAAKVPVAKLPAAKVPAPMPAKLPAAMAVPAGAAPAGAAPLINEEADILKEAHQFTSPSHRVGAAEIAFNQFKSKLGLTGKTIAAIAGENIRVDLGEGPVWRKIKDLYRAEFKKQQDSARARPPR
jgi:hypothetical protein